MNIWAKDTMERAGFTALQAFLAVFSVTDLSTAKTAAVAAVAALFAVVKAAVASRLQTTISPAGVL